MRAVFHTTYGPPDELQLKEVEKPLPKDDEVLIKIHATTVTTTDCNVRNFTFVPGVFQIPARLFMFGVFKPRINILGIDLAGEIVAVGKDVKQFKPGDQVFGTPGIAFGAHAQYTCMPADGVLTIKPPDLSWEKAAAVFLGAHTALFYLRDKGDIQAGHKILVHGASGAIGTYAVQLARHFGAEVTGGGSAAKLDKLSSIGRRRACDLSDRQRFALSLRQRAR